MSSADLPAPVDGHNPLSDVPSGGLPRSGTFYASLWRTLPRELGFLVVTLPVALAGFVTTITLFSSGVGTVIAFFIGVIVLILALYVSRGFGLLELLRLQAAGRPPIARPEWQDARARQGFFGWLRSIFGNGHYWLYLLHTMIVNFVVSLVSWTVTIVWVATALGGITYWFWQMFLPARRDWHLSGWAVGVFQPGFIQSGAPGTGYSVIDAVAYLLIGVILLATLPFATRGLVLAHWAIARGMLGAFRSDALQREVVAANASRGAAVSAEGASLRRLERDIHDGPQQRLVRLQMDLAAADRQIATDPEKARATIAEAMTQSKEALEELRSLSRGFAPPILLDRGLVAALESAATRSSVPARVRSALDPDAELPQEIERNAYFVASEALTNVVKHAGATSVDVLVGIGRDTPPAGSGRTGEWLDVRVIDDGRGGASLVPGHGLDGLEERLRGLGGVLTVDSPPGGPTTISARFPFFA